MLSAPRPPTRHHLTRHRLGLARRWTAVMFLLLLGFYLGACGLDRCDETPGAETQVCHLLCSDGCATAPVPTTPAPPARDPEPRPVYEAWVVRPLPVPLPEPEKAPPRA